MGSSRGKRPSTRAKSTRPGTTMPTPATTEVTPSGTTRTAMQAVVPKKATRRRPRATI